MYNNILSLYSKEDTVMAQICSKCGVKMKKRDWSGEWECPKCGTVRVDHSEDEYEYDSLYNDRPDYCKACDGDTYPSCVDGCPLANR